MKREYINRLIGTGINYWLLEQLEKSDKTTPIDGLTIERLLKEKLQRDASILGTVFADVRTMVCQNTCSGHGVCNSDTRACFCEAFWMPSFGYFWGFEEANCGEYTKI